jgi:hypothetical protein
MESEKLMAKLLLQDEPLPFPTRQHFMDVCFRYGTTLLK